MAKSTSSSLKATSLILLASLMGCCTYSALAAADNGDAAQREPTQEEKYLARFPQPAKVSHLVGLPVLDGQDSTIGYVREVVRTTDGKIKLIVPYAPYFGWASSKSLDRFRRPVAVPLEVVAILGSQIDALDMERPAFDKAPTWSDQQGTPLSPDDTVKIGLQRR